MPTTCSLGFETAHGSVLQISFDKAFCTAFCDNFLPGIETLFWRLLGHLWKGKIRPIGPFVIRCKVLSYECPIFPGCPGQECIFFSEHRVYIFKTQCFVFLGGLLGKSKLPQHILGQSFLSDLFQGWAEWQKQWLSKRQADVWRYERTI